MQSGGHVMQRRVNVLVPFACPHCNSEMTITLDQWADEKPVWCARCRTMVSLREETLLGVPPPEPPQPARHTYW